MRTSKSVARRRVAINKEYKIQKQQYNKARLSESKYYDEKYKEYKEIAESLIPQLPSIDINDVIKKENDILQSIQNKKYQKEQLIKKIDRVLGKYITFCQTITKELEEEVLNLTTDDVIKATFIEEVKEEIRLLELEIEKLEEYHIEFEEEIGAKQYAIRKANKDLKEIVKLKNGVKNCIKQYYEYCDEFGIEKTYCDIKAFKKEYVHFVAKAEIALNRKNYAKSIML